MFKEKLPEDKKARTIILADIVLVVLLIFTLLLVGCKNLLTGGKKQKEETAISEEMEKTTKRKNKTVSFTISAVGDCTLERMKILLMRAVCRQNMMRLEILIISLKM